MTWLLTKVSALAKKTTPGSVIDRWAWYVLRGAVAEGDLKTLPKWATEVAVSTSVLRDTCKTVQVMPHDARDLMRALSSMFRGSQLDCDPSMLLDFADIRTLRHFQKRAGRRSAPVLIPPKSRSFLSHNVLSIRIIRALLF